MEQCKNYQIEPKFRCDHLNVRRKTDTTHTPAKWMTAKSARESTNWWIVRWNAYAREFYLLFILLTVPSSLREIWLNTPTPSRYVNSFSEFWVLTNGHFIVHQRHTMQWRNVRDGREFLHDVMWILKRSKLVRKCKMAEDCSESGSDRRTGMQFIEIKTDNFDFQFFIDVKKLTWLNCSDTSFPFIFSPSLCVNKW